VTNHSVTNHSVTNRCRPVADDSGQMMILIVGFAVIVALLITVVANATHLYQEQRNLLDVADGAATAGAQAYDEHKVYELEDDVPLSAERVETAVRDYLEAAGAAGRFDGFAVRDIATDGRIVSVTLEARVRMPFINLVSEKFRDGAPIDETASARSPLLPAR
jgi:hypothetical protein